MFKTILRRGGRPATMIKGIAEVLKLQGFIVYRQEVHDSRIIVRVGRPRGAGRCPRCGSTKISEHSRSKKPQLKLHGQAMNRLVYLEVRPRRYRCYGCHRTFTEPLPGVDPWQRRTRMAEAQILEEARDRNLSAAGRRFNLGYHAVRHSLKHFQSDAGVRMLEDVQGPLKLGIDEHSFRGRNMAITITLLYPIHQLVSILPDDRKLTLVNFLRLLPQGIRDRVSEVCIDMKPSFKNAVKSVLPNAIIVLDHFHVIQDAGRWLEQARLIEQEPGHKSIPRWPLIKNSENLTLSQNDQLGYILQKYPRLKGFYWVKETLRSFYKAGSKQEAATILDRIILNARCGDDPELYIWARTLQRWRKELLNYFNSRTTNAYTEGVHTKIKWLKRTSFGFRNMEVYVKRLLLAFLPTVSLVSVHTY